jgi:hypothetical protein
MTRIEADLKPSGMGKVVIDGVDISGISSGINIHNSVKGGTWVEITIPAPLVNLKAESGEVSFKIGDRVFHLAEITED